MKLDGQHRGTRRMNGGVVAHDVQLAQILPGDLPIRADVHHVDSPDLGELWPQVLYGLGDHPFGDQRLPQADFIRNQEPFAASRLEVQVPEHVFDGPLLERFEARHNGIHIRRPELNHSFPPAAPSTAAPTPRGISRATDSGRPRSVRGHRPVS